MTRVCNFVPVKPCGYAKTIAKPRRIRYNIAVSALKYKMLISDFDGTLTDPDGKIPQENVQAVRDYIAAGGIFTVSTGRMHQSITKQLDAIGLAGKSIPLVSFQGALIVDTATGQRLHTVEMDRNTVRKILAYCGKAGKYVHYYSFDRLYVNKYDGTARQYAEYTDIAEYVTDTGGLAAYMDAHPEIPICKMLIIDEPESIMDTERQINAYLDGEAVFSRSSGRLTECVDNAAGKGNAVLRLSQMYGIPIAEIAAAGDAGNDISMIRAAGLGIAMGNAPDYVKAAAGYVAGHNRDAGLSKAIYKILNGEL